MNKNDILNVFKFRHACKEFNPDKKINDEDFNFIMETARLSPSSFGIEPWEFLIIQNPEIREKIKAYTWGGQKQIPTCSHLVVCLVKKSYFMKYNSDYVEYFMRDIQKNTDEMYELRSKLLKKFQESDFALLDSDRALFDWSCKQTYIALGNMLTSAAMIGIDSCPIEGFQKKEVEEGLALSCKIDIEKYGVSYMVAFGYRIYPQKTKTRQEAKDIIHWV
ncbi:MAG: NAD(P)H-dependent oxidoreductase [Deltaproteobacteria bacterium]|nr:MAG: NAD(P)H-dependent oxidoreductase [Deltaproteobacteria bacterium]